MTGKILEAMITYYNGDIKRINHALKVYGYAKTIGMQEKLDKVTLKTLEVSAILHDIGIPESIQKYGSSLGKYQEKLGMVIGKQILDNFQLDDAFVEKVLFIIGNHHSYNVDGGIILQIIFEADFLVNLEEGNLKDASPKEIMECNFKTDTGIRLIKSIYSIN